jgi:hypothetical protein
MDATKLSRALNGLMDEFYIFNKTLTDKEIRNVMNSQCDGDPKTTTQGKKQAGISYCNHLKGKTSFDIIPMHPQFNTACIVKFTMMQIRRPRDFNIYYIHFEINGISYNLID